MKDSRAPSDPGPRRTAGRSSDARGETGTDADRVAAPTRGMQPGDVGGIPATADAGLTGRDGKPGRQRAAPPTDRSQVKQDTPASAAAHAAGARPAGATPEAKDEGPLESLGKAISAPMRNVADDDTAANAETAARTRRSKKGPQP